VERDARERQVVAEMHGRATDLYTSLADVEYDVLVTVIVQAEALQYAHRQLLPHWRLYHPDETFTLSKALKIAPREVVDRVLERLYWPGHGEGDGLPPRPER
jgi:hypothetical protein